MGQENGLRAGRFEGDADGARFVGGRCRLFRPALFVDYGQVPAAGERRAATAIAEALDVPLREARCDVRELGAGPLAGKPPVRAAAPEGWPYRNQLLVTIAAMALADDRPSAILLGSVGEDAVHADGTLAFLGAIGTALRVQGGPTVEAPALGLSGRGLLEASGLPLAIAGYTFSCHASDWACGACRGCAKHADALAWMQRG